MSLVHLPPTAPRRQVPRMQAQEHKPPSRDHPGMSCTAYGSSPPCLVKLTQNIGKPAFKLGTSSRHSLGWGTGALASRPIGRGELLLTEQPLVIQHEDQPRSSHSIFTALCLHPTDLQEAYLSLSNAFASNAKVDALVGIFNTNCLPLAPVTSCPVPTPYPSASSEQAHAVFLTLSKFNTSCRPNASFTWDESRNAMSIHAIEPILLGDEITICYGQPLFASCSERREYLMRSKGFRCVCPQCTLQGEEARASDQRRTELCRLFKAIPFLGHDAPAGLRIVR